MFDSSRVFAISMVRGSTYILNRVCRDYNGRLVDLSGAQIFMSVRADMKIQPTFTLSSSANPGSRLGIVIQDQLSKKGEFVITLVPSDTINLAAHGFEDPWIYDVVIVLADGTRIYEITQSPLGLYPQVTN
jgi:hypothetical protein